MKRYIFSIIIMLIFLCSIRNNSIYAKDNWDDINEEEYRKLDLFLKTDEMVDRISFLLQEKICANDIKCSNIFKVNILPDNFTDLWTYAGDIRDIYGDTWQYKIPMVINDKSIVISIGICDNKSLEYLGISYGNDLRKLLLDKVTIENELTRENIDDTDILYSDVLYSNKLNTLIIHYNVKNKKERDYLIPVSLIDIKSYLPWKEFYDSYEDGKIFSSAELITILSHTEILRGDNFDGEKSGGISSKSDSIIGETDYTEFDIDGNGVASQGVLYGGVITAITLIMIFLLKKRMK